VDPGENVNLVDREPSEAQRMRRLLDDHLEQAPADAVRDTGVRIDPSIAQKPRAMGYLQ